MRYPKSIVRLKQRRRERSAAAGLSLALLFAAAGCNGLPSTKETATETPQNVPPTYMAPVAGNSSKNASALASYVFDDFATPKTFTEASSQLPSGNQSEIDTSGNVVPLARNLLELETTYTYPVGQSGEGITGTTYSPALPGGWALQLPDKTGGLVELFQKPAASPQDGTAQPVTPLVEAVCPASATAQTYNFITLPNALLAQAAGSSQTPAFQKWDPVFETAYGSVDISGTGSSVTLANIKQSTLAGTAPGTTTAASATGVCGSTLYGNTISLPGALTITNPGNGEAVSASATIGISASGLLVEDNGSNLANGSAYANGLYYQNALGAGTGAIGLLKPSSAVATGGLVGAQYNGFIFGSGNQANSQANFSSTVASFGFSTVPASCASVTSPTGTLIYGGDFPSNDPSAAAVQTGGGFGNCDYAIDLGTQSGSSNGVYPAATVWVGASFGGNSTGGAYSFPAVAIAGTVAGKNAIFVLGVDTTGTPNQAVGIYLLQSN